jgi:hypothetical protein
LPPLQEIGQGDFRFQACQRSAKAKVNPMAERDMRIRLPPDVEPVSAWKLALVTNCEPVVFRRLFFRFTSGPSPPAA